MATGVDQQESVDSFDEFFREYYRDEIGTLARNYPSEQKSLYVDWDDLYRFDRDLADEYLNQPEQLQRCAEEALRVYDLPIDVSLGQAHVRVHNIPEATDIRELRAEHVNDLVAVKGIVRKATDVRPKCQNAAFRCVRCETLTRVPQEGGTFQEPHECRSCERQGPFQLSEDQSEFVDAQRLRVQESPEGLRGGETPQAIDIDIEDDVTGEVTPGDHVTATGILRLDQDTGGEDSSPIFDVHMEGVAVVVDDEEFEDMDITAEDEETILELASRDDVYEQMIGAIAPSIHGYDQEKLAMTLQLFSGVTKHLPDESRIRGDLHILFIGDPGTGKCVSGDTTITLGDGTTVPIRDFVESNLDDPVPVDDGVYDTVDCSVPSMAPNGTMTSGTATKVWKREAPDRMYRVQTSSGREIEVTPSHPLFVQSGGSPEARRAEELEDGDFVAVPAAMPTTSDNIIDADFRRSQSRNAVRFDPPRECTPSLARLLGYVIAEGYVTLNDDKSGEAVVTNNDSEILEDVADAFEQLGLPYTERESRNGKSACEISCTSSEFVSYLEQLEPAILQSSYEQRVPSAIERASEPIQCAFLRAYVDSEGTVSGSQRELSVASMSRELLEGVQQILVQFDVQSQLRSRQNGSFRLSVGGDDFERFRSNVGFVTDRKAAAAAEHEGTPSNTNTNLVPVDSEQLERVRDALALSQFECGVPRTTYQHYERGDRVPSRATLRKIVDTFEERIELFETLRDRVETGEWDAVETAREELGLSQAALADAMDVTQTAISYYERNDVVPDGGHVRDAATHLSGQIDAALAVREDVEQIRSMAEAEVSWDRIEAIEAVDPQDEWVYDLEVEGTHTYVSNGVVSHNSQLLQYVRNIAPRSVYTSGKGSSSAGLTAAAVRDDFGDGQQWTLEAGALVLADQGVAAVDELDKMRCVTGDTLVHLGDGRVSRIQDLALESVDDGVIEELENGRTIRDVDLTAWTMTDDGRLVRRPVTAIHEYEAPTDLTEVQLESGESLTATPDHPYFVFENGRRVERPANELSAGDWVYVPRNDPTTAADGGTASLARADRLPYGEESDVAAVRIEAVETVPAATAGDADETYADDRVYDLTVEGTHNFVANGMVVHNSEDRSAMHEALEQQSISISKAGINATLKSRCSLLGAANPIHGRFDQYEPMGEQIDLEPALISRFDLIFTVTDEPDPEADAELAEHILEANYAGQLNTQRQEMPSPDVTEEEVQAAQSNVEPTIEPELLRKYVAYSQQSCYPRMTDDAREAIRDFYVELRSKGADEDAPVPVTARKLEALVRLAEASARVRLADEVRVEDAERVIEIVRSCLQDIGVDPETGEFDADIIETGTSKTQRDRIKNLKALIDDMAEEFEEGVPVDQLLDRADDVGIGSDKAERELEKLKQKGEVYEPRTDHVRTT